MNGLREATLTEFVKHLANGEISKIYHGLLLESEETKRARTLLARNYVVWMLY